MASKGSTSQGELSSGTQTVGVCAHHETYFEILSGVRDGVRNLNAGMQGLLTDVAVIKQRMESLEGEQVRLRDHFFGDPAGYGVSLPDRLTKMEAAVGVFDPQDIEIRLTRVEDNGVTQEDVKKFYGSVLSSLWKFVAAVAVALVVAAVGFVVNSYEQSRTSSTMNASLGKVLEDLTAKGVLPASTLSEVEKVEGK